MSYDVFIMIDTGDEWPAVVQDCGNYTYNCGGMLNLACGKYLSDLDGMPCTEVAPILITAVKDMAENPDKYIALNPDNGWGSFDGFRSYLLGILTACQRHSKAQLKVA